MKLNVLKQASLPDALTAELARRYHLVELTALTDFARWPAPLPCSSPTAKPP
jgi:hypothetical protein